MSNREIANVRTSGRLEIHFEDDDASAAAALGIVLSGSVDDCIHRSIEAVNLGARLWLEAGYLLLKAQSKADHGDWEKQLQRHGVPKQRASELMSAAKFYTSRTPEERAQLLTLGKSKMVLLARADAEVVNDLLANPAEDGLQNLSVRELRASLAKAESDRVNLQSRLNTAEARATALEKGSPRLTAFEPFTEDVRTECMHLQGQAQIAIEGLEQLFQDAVNKSDATSPEHRLRMEQVWIAAHVVAARASDLLGTLSQVDYGLPDRVKGEHILTPPEAEAWIQGWNTLKAEASATRYAREEARAMERAAQQPRGRGRPRKNPTAE